MSHILGRCRSCVKLHFVRSIDSSESSVLSRLVILCERNNATWLGPSISAYTCSLILRTRTIQDIQPNWWKSSVFYWSWLSQAQWLTTWFTPIREPKKNSVKPSKQLPSGQSGGQESRTTGSCHKRNRSQNANKAEWVKSSPSRHPRVIETKERLPRAKSRGGKTNENEHY